MAGMSAGGEYEIHLYDKAGNVMKAVCGIVREGTMTAMESKLRDQLAESALSMILRSPQNLTPEEVGIQAYDIADAMIERRKK